MITYSQFIEYLPEFSAQDRTLVERAIALLEVEVNEYEGLNKSELQGLAIMLHVAHNLTVSSWASEGKSGAVKALASNNDRIEFAVSPYAGMNFESTSYGIRLVALLRRANTVFMVC